MKTAVALGLLIATSGLTVIADLDEAKKAIETRYTQTNTEQRSEPALPPAGVMIQFNLGFVSDSGKYVRVWFKDDKSVMESHIAIHGLADYELDSLRERNVGKSEWLAIPVDADLKQNGRIWLRKDRLVAAFAVKKPIAGPYRTIWLTTSFTVGYLEVLKVQINKGELVADLPFTRSLWTNLEKFLESHSK